MQEIRFPHVAAVIRTWGDRDNGTSAAVHRAVEAGVAKVVVVVKAYNLVEGWMDDLWIGNVAEWLKKLMVEHRDRILIHEITDGPFNRSWSMELNSGVDIAKQVPGVTHVLAVSKEVHYGSLTIQDMVSAAAPGVGVVTTSFHGVSGDGLGVTYAWGRNTLALWSLATLDKIGGFDEALDGLHGMEDVIASIVMLESEAGEFRYLDLSAAVMIGVNYDQAAKEVRERAGLHVGLKALYERLDDPAKIKRIRKIAEDFLSCRVYHT